MIKVEFITLGEASKKLNVPAPTLRHWTDQLEEYRVHFVKRNNRNERIYEVSDLDIFAFLRDLKEEHGRRTTTKDLAIMIQEKAEIDGTFDLRREEDAPAPKTNKTAELLGQEDIKRLMESQRVQQFMGIIRDELKEGIREEVSKEMAKTNQMILESHQRIEQSIKEREERERERVEQRDEALMKLLRESTERKKGFLGRLLGK